MKKSFYLLIVLSCFGLKSYACECSKMLWAEWSENGIKNSINNNGLIVIGELISSTTEGYKFKVIEVFKGTIKKNQIIEGAYPTSCSGRPHPKRTGKWIFYGNYEEYENEQILDFNTCGPTRSLEYPSIFSKEQNKNYWKQELQLLNIEFKKTVKFEI